MLNWRKVTSTLSLFALITVLGTSHAWAQFRSGIEGTVTDPSGAVVPNATVTAKDAATNVTRSTQTSAAGTYRIDTLGASTFDLTVSAQGFKTVVQKGILLETNQVRAVNLTLELGTTTTEVTITAAPPAIETSEARVSTQIAESRVKNLPLQGRNFYSLVVLTAGVTGLPSGGGQAYAQASADIFNTEFGVNTNANGQRAESNSYLVDSGSVNASPRGGVANLTPNSDSVQELRISVNNFSAEYGRNSSLLVNVATKSGTNDFHGTAGWFHTDNALIARNTFQKAYNSDGSCAIARWDGSCNAIPVLRRNEYNISIGGPIRKDKTFFFYSMDYLRSGVGTTFVTQVPHADFLNFLSTTLPNGINTEVTNSFLPAGSRGTTVKTVADEAVRAGLIANTAACPAGGINYTSHLGYNQTFPCSLALTQNFTYNNVVSRDGDQQNFRIDHNWNEAKQRIYFNFYHTARRSVNFASPNVYPGFDGQEPEYTYYFNTNYTHTFSPTVLYETSLTVTRVRGDIGIANGNIPNISVPGISSYGMGFTGPTFLQTNGEWRNVLSWNRGSHSFKGGFTWAIEDGWKSGAQFGQEWTRYFYSFNNLFDFALDDPFQESNYGIDPKSGNKLGPSFLPAFPRMGLFFNDDWKVRHNLTVQLGLRWEYFGIPYEQSAANNFSGAVFNSGNDFFSRIADMGVQKKSPLDSSDKNNFAPRISFAWDPTGKGKMSIRAGFGTFYDRFAGQFFGDCCTTLPVFATVTARQDQPLGPQPVFGLGTLTTTPYNFPSMVGIIPGLDSRGGLISGKSSVGIWDPNLRAQYSFNWFFGLQYALGNNWTVEANYVGSNGHKLYQEYDVNRFRGDLLDGTLDRLNPSFGGIGYGQANGASAYAGMNATVRKRYSRGLDFQVAYTYGKSVDTASSFGRGLQFVDIYDLNLNRGLANFDVRQKLAASLLYEFPSYKGGAGALGKFLSGWQIGATTIAQADQPFSVYCGASFSGGCDYNADGFNYDYPNAPSFGHEISGGNDAFLSGVFQASDFPKPAAGTDGTLGRNTYIGPGYFATDLNLQKDTKIPWFWHDESAKIQFRAEMYNAFNQTNLTPPDGSLTSGNFGKSTSAYSPRNIMFGLKLYF